jgi:hypothetical protein
MEFVFISLTTLGVALGVTQVAMFGVLQLMPKKEEYNERQQGKQND